MKRRKQLGDRVFNESSRQSADVFAREWWIVYATKDLAPKR
ncbi:MAG TPA: hypothetical protein VGU02_01280 [Gaiellaceae bacterium]|nr:hypothetical protein [Gaiellaceae bacterium]